MASFLEAQYNLYSYIYSNEWQSLSESARILQHKDITLKKANSALSYTCTARFTLMCFHECI